MAVMNLPETGNVMLRGRNKLLPKSKVIAAQGPLLQLARQQRASIWNSSAGVERGGKGLRTVQPQRIWGPGQTCWSAALSPAVPTHLSGPPSLTCGITRALLQPLQLSPGAATGCAGSGPAPVGEQREPQRCLKTPPMRPDLRCPPGGHQVIGGLLGQRGV